MKGFMDESNYNRVVSEVKLSDGTVLPMPVTLDINQDMLKTFEVGKKVALLDGEGNPIAIMTVDSIWEPDRAKEAQFVFGTEVFIIKNMFISCYTLIIWYF